MKSFFLSLEVAFFWSFFGQVWENSAAPLKICLRLQTPMTELTSFFPVIKKNLSMTDLAHEADGVMLCPCCGQPMVKRTACNIISKRSDRIRASYLLLQ